MLFRIILWSKWLHQQGTLRRLAVGNELPALEAVVHATLGEVFLLVLLGKELQGLLEPLDALVEVGFHLLRLS